MPKTTPKPAAKQKADKPRPSKKVTTKKTVVEKKSNKAAKATSTEPVSTSSQKVTAQPEVVSESAVKPSPDGEGKKNLPPNENNPNSLIARKVMEEMLVSRVATSDLKTIKTDPTSMEELLAATGYELQGVKKGQEVAATLTDKGKRVIFFDIGAKTEGILLDKEMDYISDFISFLRSGDTVKAVVVSPENDRGQILLSLNKTASAWRWSLFERYKNLEEAIEVRGLDINRGGMIARLMNVRGFIPVSQFGRQWVGKLDQLYNRVFSVKIIEVDAEKNRLIFSEKAVSESEIIGQQQDLLSKVKSGDTYKAQVSGVMPFGIFVRVLMDKAEVEGVFLDGLVHISEISWEKVNDVARRYTVGDMVDVMVLNTDDASGKLNLSIKRLTKDPWEDIASTYPVDSKLKGTITRLAAYGAFVEIAAGIEGLIHISKIPSDHDMKVGDTADVYVETIDVKNHRISLGMMLTEKPVGYK